MGRRMRAGAGNGLDRRRLLAALAALAVAPLIRPASAHARQARLRAEVAPGVYVHKGQHALFSPENGGDISNAGFVVGKDAVAVVDTGGSARVGAELKLAIRAVTDLPIRYVINTHMHPDHVFGNAAFADDAPAFVGHAKLARGLAARSERYLAINKELMGEAAFAGTRIILPNLSVEDHMTLDLGGRTLELEAEKTAHTDNDLIVRDTATSTVFLGDLLFSEHVPTLDGSIRGWLALMERLTSRSRGARRAGSRTAFDALAGRSKTSAALSQPGRDRCAPPDQGEPHIERGYGDGRPLGKRCVAAV